MKKILVIDDAATVRLFHRTLLTEAGYEVDEAINGVEALEKALQCQYQLYLVDVNMPLLDGYGFLREIRRHDQVQVPAIMVSTEAEESDRAQAYEAGANLYLVKPTNAEVLLAPIMLLLGEDL